MATDAEFPYSLYVPPLAQHPNSLPKAKDQPQTNHHHQTTRTITFPLPTPRLASSALRALEVDSELSPYVRRDLSLATPDQSTPTSTSASASAPQAKKQKTEEEGKEDGGGSVLLTTYRATTNRMLRVAVNGFMESLGVVLGVMEELDVDVLEGDGDGDIGADGGMEVE